jgi:hypothetical protein
MEAIVLHEVRSFLPMIIHFATATHESESNLDVAYRVDAV